MPPKVGDDESRSVLPPVEVISEHRGSLKVEARMHEHRGWEIRVLDEDTRVGLPRVLYADYFPTMTKSQAQVRITVIWLKLGEEDGV